MRPPATVSQPVFSGDADEAEHFGLRITPAMAELINPHDPHDPIAAQFIPSDEEGFIAPAERADPIGDERFSPVDSIVHRYPDRVLLKLLHSCAVHCRFCFRRDYVGKPDNVLNDEKLSAALAYIESHPEIWEVILTGGDPLMLSPRRLREVMTRLNRIAHVKIVRFHTRIPVVDPARITTELAEALLGRTTVYVLLHCNHPRELTEAARKACATLVGHGIPLLSQSVLLRGVNDSEAVLEELMRAFVESRVIPHYLHHGDLARGTSHFRVSIERGQRLMRHLRGRVSGLAQPHYMVDLPGGHGKSPLDPVYALSSGKRKWSIEDYRGNRHDYEEILCPAEDTPS